MAVLGAVALIVTGDTKLPPDVEQEYVADTDAPAGATFSITANTVSAATPAILPGRAK
jgi:hypothetical protein